MKNIVRAFVVALVLTSAAASAHKASAAPQPAISGTLSALPVPSCAPDDPNACGLGTN